MSLFSPLTRLRHGLTAGSIAVFVLSGCGAGAGSAPATNATPSGAPAPASYQPVTVQSCGETLTFDAPPSRVVSTGQEATEILLTLGLADRIVGVSRTYNALPAELEADFAQVPQLAGEESAPREVTLAARPDFVVAPYVDFDFDAAEGLATEEDLAATGAQIFGLRVNCTGTPAASTLEDTYADLLDLGRIFGVSERAEQIVTEMRATVSDVQSKIAGRPPVSVLAYANGEGPLGVSGAGLGNDLIRLAGGRNVFADLAEGFGQVTIEAAAQRDPEAFVVNFYEGGPSAQEKIDLLTRVLPNSPAAKERRAVGIDDAALNEGVRNADAVAALARALHPDAF